MPKKQPKTGKWQENSEYETMEDTEDESSHTGNQTQQKRKQREQFNLKPNSQSADPSQQIPSNNNKTQGIQLTNEQRKAMGGLFYQCVKFLLLLCLLYLCICVFVCLLMFFFRLANKKKRKAKKKRERDW